jgi:tRNA (cytidine32/uridine32-2'-O)-methyltransferase
MEAVADIRFVLFGPMYTGNIGSVARAIKTMGYHDLVIVNPPPEFPNNEARQMASAAQDVLAGARIVGTLAEAVAGCGLVVGTTARYFRLGLPELDPRECAAQLLSAARVQPAALVFGPERSGLTNAELDLCHAIAYIPANPDYDSLNLAQAVQVLAYCVRGAALSAQALPAVPGERREDPPATIEQMERMFGHFEEALTDIDFFKGRPYGHLMQRIRRMLHRADLDSREVMILRGILAEAQRMARLAQGAVNK